MKNTLKFLLAAAVVVAAAGAAHAGEDAWRYRHQPFPGAEQGDDSPATPAPAPARKTVSQDERITDATSDFDTALYPKRPVKQLVFWGFEGAKTDESKAEDAFCDQDVAVLRANVRKAAAGLPAEEAAKLSVSKTVLTTTSQYCPDAGEDQHGGYHRAPDCETVSTGHCAAVLRSASPRLAVQYKEAAVSPAACAAPALDPRVLAEMSRTAVIDSHVKAGPQGKGCVMQLLELVER